MQANSPKYLYYCMLLTVLLQQPSARDSAVRRLSAVLIQNHNDIVGLVVGRYNMTVFKSSTYVYTLYTMRQNRQYFINGKSISKDALCHFTMYTESMQSVGLVRQRTE